MGNIYKYTNDVVQFIKAVSNSEQVKVGHSCLARLAQTRLKRAGSCGQCIVYHQYFA